MSCGMRVDLEGSIVITKVVAEAVNRVFEQS